MKIKRLEQSGFVIETEKGFRLAMDVASKTPVETLEIIKPIDAFLVSHIHGDHFDIATIKKIAPQNLYLNHECLEAVGEESLSSNITEVKSGDSIALNEIKVTYFTVDHGPNISAPVENLGFLIEVEGKKIYFAGDMFYESGLDVTKLEVDYALIPVGTFYTFGPEEAFNFVKKFKKIGKIIPMHERGEPEHIQKFLELVNGTFETE